MVETSETVYIKKAQFSEFTLIKLQYHYHHFDIMNWIGNFEQLNNLVNAQVEGILICI